MTLPPRENHITNRGWQKARSNKKEGSVPDFLGSVEYNVQGLSKLITCLKCYCFSNYRASTIQKGSSNIKGRSDPKPDSFESLLKPVMIYRLNFCQKFILSS